MKPLVLSAGSCISRHFLYAFEEFGLDFGQDCEFLQIYYGLDEKGKLVTPSIDKEKLNRTVFALEEGLPWGDKPVFGYEEGKCLFTLPPNTPILTFPTLHFTSLWPLSGHDPRSETEAKEKRSLYPGAYADRLALKIMEEYETIEERVKAYMAININDFIDLNRFHEMQIEDFFNREKTCDIKTAAYVASNFRHTNLFYARHHPAGVLISYMLAKIFNHEKLQPFCRHDITTYLNRVEIWRKKYEIKIFGHDFMPIHPQIAHHFDLQWWRSDLRYTLPLCGNVTFDQWLSIYMT